MGSSLLKQSEQLTVQDFKEDHVKSDKILEIANLMSAAPDNPANLQKKLVNDVTDYIEKAGERNSKMSR